MGRNNPIWASDRPAAGSYDDWAADLEYNPKDDADSEVGNHCIYCGELAEDCECGERECMCDCPGCNPREEQDCDHFMRHPGPDPREDR